MYNLATSGSTRSAGLKHMSAPTNSAINSYVSFIYSNCGIGYLLLTYIRIHCTDQFQIKKKLII